MYFKIFTNNIVKIAITSRIMAAFQLSKEYNHIKLWK